MKNLLTSCVILIFILCKVGIVHGGTVIVDFGGRITEVGDYVGPTWEGIFSPSINDSYHGTFTYIYETVIEDSNPNMNLGVYWYPVDYVLYLNGLTVESSGGTATYIVDDDFNDSFSILDHSPIGTSDYSPNSLLDDVYFQFFDSTGTVFNNDNLPSMFPFSAFDSGSVAVLGMPTLEEYFSIKGSIDYITCNSVPIPEPATNVLFGTGFAVLVGVRFRRAVIL